MKKSLIKDLLKNMPTTLKFLESHNYEIKNHMHIKDDLSEKEAAARAIMIDLLEDNGSLLKNEHLHFTESNGKLGSISSIAFSVYITCKGVACYKNQTCYAMHQHFNDFTKFYYAIVNTLIYLYSKKQFMKELNAYLDLHVSKYFRWFESGDFINSAMVEDINKIADKHKKVCFLVMSKKFSFIREYLLNGGTFRKNLIVKPSNNSHDDQTIFDDEILKSFSQTDIINNQDELKKDWFLCPASIKTKNKDGSPYGCDNCFKCWNNNLNVAFKIHR